jgi:hypothetical protein
LEEIGIPTLTSEQVEELCELAEKAAREYISSKIPMKRVSSLNIAVDIEGANPITVKVDIDLDLSPKMKDYDAKKLADEATQQTFASIEKHLRQIRCKSKK